MHKPDQPAEYDRAEPGDNADYQRQQAKQTRGSLRALSPDAAVSGEVWPRSSSCSALKSLPIHHANTAILRVCGVVAHSPLLCQSRPVMWRQSDHAAGLAHLRPPKLS